MSMMHALSTFYPVEVSCLCSQIALSAINAPYIMSLLVDFAFSVLFFPVMSGDLAQAEKKTNL